MESDCDEWRILGRKCSTKQKGRLVSAGRQNNERDSKGDREMEREMLSAVSNNALTISVAEIKSSGLISTSIPVQPFTVHNIASILHSMVLCIYTMLLEMFLKYTLHQI